MKIVMQLFMVLILSLSVSYAEEMDADSIAARTQLKQYCSEIPNYISNFQQNLDDGTIKSVQVESEAGKIKHDIFIKINVDGQEDFLSCHLEFATPYLDKSLHEMQAFDKSEGLNGVACVERDGSVDPASDVESTLAGLQKVADKAMCEANKQSSLGDCAKNMAYCGVDNLNLAGVLKMEKPKGSNCSGLLGGAVGAYADAGQCMATFIRGAFNEITDTLKFLVVEAPVWLYDKTFGDWFGEPAVEQMENVESLESIASSVASDEEIVAEQAEPEKAFMDKVVAFTENLILQKGVENFGCESWSSGIPGVGTCLNPPPSWECADCKQKAMAICGVAGYATGLVVETAVLATPVGIIAGTVAGLSKANKVNKATKAGKAISGGSNSAAGITKAGVAVGKAGMSVLAPIAKTGFVIGKKTIGYLKLIPGVTLTAKVLSSPIRGFLKADDFLTSKAWNVTYHGSKAYTQALAKTGNVGVAVNAAKTASRVSQTQKVGSQLLQTQSEIRLTADKAVDKSLSKAERTNASRKQQVLTAKMRKQEATYTDLRASIKPDDLEGAHMASSNHVAEVVNKYKSQDAQIVGDMQKYGLNHVQKVETLMPEGGLILKMDDDSKILVQVNPGDEYTDYLTTMQKVADEGKIDDVDALRELAYMPSDKLHLFAEKYPKYQDPMDVLTKVYKEKYSSHMSKVKDPIDQENIVKLVRELELRQKNSTEISAKLDEVLNTCSL